MTDHYKTLNVPFGASETEIKKRFRKLATIHHPDKNAGSKKSEETFKVILNAYETLINKEKRITYDLKYQQTYQKEKTETSNHNYTQSSNNSANSGFKNQNTYQQKTNSNNETLLSPAQFLNLFKEIRKHIVTHGKKQINEFRISQNLNDLLSGINFNSLIEKKEYEIKNGIIDEVIICCKYLEYHNVKKITGKLLKLSGNNIEGIKKIQKFKNNKRLVTILNEYGPSATVIFIIAALLITLLISRFDSTDVSNSSQKPNEENRPESGELDFKK